MAKYALSAVSVAVAKANRIVYSQGFGFANPIPWTIQLATRDSLYRTASLSKPITSAAIHLLVQRGALRLSDRVFGPQGILGTTYGTKPYTNWLVQIDVQQLLEHSAGGWTNDGKDPMFRSPALSQADLITQTLDENLLLRPSGVAFAYSNFGYCLLGRVIERKSGKAYEQFVHDELLVPAGAGGMRIAQDSKAGKAPGEVVYTSTNSDPYALPVRRMDSHGGWIASAPDYVRFLLAIDGSAPDILTQASVSSMRTRSTVPGAQVYGKGVATDGVGAWHNGALDGTKSWMWSYGNGNAWCALCTGGAGAGSKAVLGANNQDLMLDELLVTMQTVYARV